MPNHVLLNNIDHQDLRVDTAHGAALRRRRHVGADVPGRIPQRAGALPDRVPQGRRRRLPAGGAVRLARRRRTCSSMATRWDATYLPLAIERQPFLIGASGERTDGPRRSRRPARRARDDGEAAVPRAWRHAPNTSTAIDVGAAGDARGHARRRRRSSTALLRARAARIVRARYRSSTTARRVGFAGFHTDQRGAPARARRRRAASSCIAPATCEPIYMAIASLSQLRDLIERMNRARCRRA